MSVLDTLKEIAAEIKDDALDVEEFFVDAYAYEAQNISAQLAKITADCVAAAEQSLTQSSGTDKYAFAFGNIVAAAAKDGIQFEESMVDFAIQGVIAERNKRLAAAKETA